jgi:BON domain-containing protein
MDWPPPMSQILSQPRNEPRSGQHATLPLERDSETKAVCHFPKPLDILPDWHWGQRGDATFPPLAPMRLKGKTEDADLNPTSLHVAEILEDLRLAQQVERELQTTDHLALGPIRAFASGRVVILQGSVPSYQLKNVAETTALSVIGVERVHNDLEIVES